MSDDAFRIPADDKRVAIIGRTGSGKTQFATWMLGERSITTKPWVVFNFKGDRLIDDIPGTRELTIDANVPKAPGLYVMRPLPDEAERVDEFLWKAWERENVGLYVDEGYMLTGLKGFRACLTQGRSKNIAMMILSQRPVWMDRFTWSEADYFGVFNLGTGQDRATVREYVPRYPLAPLPEYHCLWHDVARDRTVLLRPVPERDRIIARFRDRIGIKRRAI